MVVSLVTVAAAAVLIVGVRSTAQAVPNDVARLATIVTSPGGWSRKAVAVEDLRKRADDSSAARARLSELADSADAQVAALAISALGRSEWSGAQTKVAQLYESTGRSDVVRGLALTAYCMREARAQRRWADCKTWVKQHAGSNAALKGQSAALKASLWASEVDNDR
jgi:hypothetical protein